MRPAFRYPDADWAAIEACLTKLARSAAPVEAAPAADAHVHAYCRHVIENIVHRFLWMTERFDPRLPEVKKANAHWKELAGHLQGALDALTELEAIETRPIRTLGYAIARNPQTPHADLLTWNNQTAEAARWAARAAKGLFPKSSRGSNRSRGDDVDKLFGDLLTFWVDLGGRVSKGSNSPSTRFVMAAISETLPAAVDVRLPRAIVDFVRDRQFDKARRIWVPRRDA
jgi:hypothetical protein